MTFRWPALLLLGALASVPSACGDDEGDDGDDTSAAVSTVFAVGTDFATAGVASTVSIPGLEMTTNAVEGVASTDPVVRRIEDRVYIVNRLGQDNVTVLDAADLTLVAQISTGAGSNPQDVAAVGDLLYVAAYGSSGLVVIDVTRPDDGVIDTVDLSALDPDDGLPNCGTVVAVGEQVIAACSILDDAEFLAPRGPGVWAVVDVGDASSVTTVPMTQVRPVGLAQGIASEDAILVPTVEDFSDPSAGGCIEQISLADEPISSGCAVDNADLGGFASALAWDPEAGRLWATVTTSFDEEDFGPYGDLVTVDVVGGAVEAAPLAEEIRPMDLAVCPSGHIAISDATRGLRVLAPDAAEELTSGPLDIGLPPVSNGLACY